MRYVLLTVLFLFVSVISHAQQFEHGFKKPKKAKIVIVNGFEKIENQLIKDDRYHHLPNLNENYFSRYDYLISPPDKIVFHPSITVKGDTMGVSLNHEYIDFYPEIVADSIIPSTYITTKFVSNADWNYFQQYIRDSIARQKLKRDFPKEFGVPTQYIEYYDEEEIDIEYYPVNNAREKWNLNWDKNLDIKYSHKNEHAKYLADMYYPQHERHYRKPEIDPRKLFFRYYFWHNTDRDGQVQFDRRPLVPYVDTLLNLDYRVKKFWNQYDDFWVGEFTSSFCDSTLWKLQMAHPHHGDMGDQLVSYYAWHPQFRDYPVTGINGFQAKAYLAWKQSEHQQYLDRKGLPYMVEYALPAPYEIGNKTLSSNVPVKDFDLSDFRITNQDYYEFLRYVRDSISLRLLSQDISVKTYMIPKYDLQGDKYDESAWPINWSKRKDVYSKDTVIREVLSTMLYPEYLRQGEWDWDPRKLYFSYYYYNFEVAAPLGDLVEANYHNTSGYDHCPKPKQLICVFERNAKRYEMIGKDLDLGLTNKLCLNNSVRSHEDRSRFIVSSRIAIYPQMKCGYDYYCEEFKGDGGRTDCCTEFFEGKRVPEYDFTTEPEASMTNITYAQAHAYYSWKQRRYGYIIKHDNVLIANYIPSKDEWQKIQKGEKLTHKAQIFDMPTPTFRYTMKFYPYNRDGR